MTSISGTGGPKSVDGSHLTLLKETFLSPMKTTAE